MLRQVIRRQITGAARTCPLSAVWVFTSAGKFKGWWGVLLSLMCCDETVLELQRLKRAKAFFIVLFSLKGKPQFFFSFRSCFFPSSSSEGLSSHLFLPLLTSLPFPAACFPWLLGLPESPLGQCKTLSKGAPVPPSPEDVEEGVTTATHHFHFQLDTLLLLM